SPPTRRRIGLGPDCAGEGSARPQPDPSWANFHHASGRYPQQTLLIFEQFVRGHATASLAR
ncbi:hypothetical protein, partial [Azospirillum sp.]|uniref:hypothetical protein n=1 Tax=Azospirillum sp. TaxID=34012 RepID=UPI002632462B